MELHARFGFSRDDIGTALGFVDRWHDNPEVGGADFYGPLLIWAAGNLPDGRAVLPDLDAVTLARFQAEIQSYAQRYPDGPVRMLDLKEVDLTHVIRAQLVPHAGSLDRAVDLVRSGKLPLGALAAAAARSYATMSIEQSSGPLYAVSADREISAGELAAAKGAINGDVVVEGSTLAVVTLLSERAPVVMSAFTAVRLPRPALADIEVAWSDLTRAPGSSYSISYDPERDALVSRVISLPEHQRLYRRITEIDQLARTLVVTDLTKPPASPDPHQAWLAAVDLAAKRSCRSGATTLRSGPSPPAKESPPSAHGRYSTLLSNSA